MLKFVLYAPLFSMIVQLQVLWVHCKYRNRMLPAWNDEQRIIDGNMHFEPASNNCSTFRDALAESLSAFTSCAIQHSRPITLCESCIDSYLNVLECYKNLSTHFQSDTQKCIDQYTNLDRLQVVDNLYNNAISLWNKAKCYECFEIENEALTRNPSKVTIEFNTLLNNTMLCINQTHADYTIYCALCIDEYLALNDYYNSISNVNDKIGVCMDIVDLMNETRLFWSEKCCAYRQKPEYVFIISVSVVTWITILFYVLTKYCTDIKQPIIVKQSRFAEVREQEERTRRS